VAWGGFDIAGCCYWRSRLAIPVGRREAEGNLAAASGDGLGFDSVDLRGLVGAFPGAAARDSGAGISEGRRMRGGGGGSADGAFRRLLERGQRRLTICLMHVLSII